MTTQRAADLTGVRLKTKSGAWLVHPDLRDRMVADAKEQGTNLTDLAVRILSERFRVPYEPNMRRSSPSRGTGDQMNLRLPDQLKRAIATQAYPDGVVEAIRKALCAHYQLSAPDAA